MYLDMTSTFVQGWPLFLPAEPTLLTPFKHPLRDDLTSELFLISARYLSHLFSQQVITEHLLSGEEETFSVPFEAGMMGSCQLLGRAAIFLGSWVPLLIPLHLSVHP